MKQLALLHALGAACTLRQALEEEDVSLLRLKTAANQLMLRCDALLHDPECAVSLAGTCEAIGVLMEQGGRAKAELSAARNALLRLIARVWVLQERERQRDLGERVA